MIKSVTCLFLNGIITIHDYKKPGTMIFNLVLTQGADDGKQLGLWMSDAELMQLHQLITEYLSLQEKDR